MRNKKIIIAGGTGFIGQSLAKYFGRDNHIVILSRQTGNGQNNKYGSSLLNASDGYNITYWRWDGKTIEKHWSREIEGADLVINLAGKSVNCRYTQRNKQEILESRTQATEAIGEAIRQSIVPPKLWINAASATIYRHTEDLANDDITGSISEFKKDNMPFSLLDQWRFRWKIWMAAIRYGKNSAETRALVQDFSVQVCKRWEGSFFDERTPFTRKIALRMAITLGNGGVMIPYLNLLKFGLGGQQGNGLQWYSWVHADDLARCIEWFWDHPTLEGVYNCSSPFPVTNKSFMDTLRKLTGHRFGLPAFNWMLELGAALIGTETELILKSRKVLPAKLIQSGFSFRYCQLDDALKAVLAEIPQRRHHFF